MTAWKSPRCSPACWKEIRQHEEQYKKMLAKVIEIATDRAEWRTQHENLLAMYREATAKIAALTRSPAEGEGVVVPREPTEAMIAAFHCELDRQIREHILEPNQVGLGPLSCWSVMVEAAALTPAPQAEAEEGAKA